MFINLIHKGLVAGFTDWSGVGGGVGRGGGVEGVIGSWKKAVRSANINCDMDIISLELDIPNYIDIHFSIFCNG